MDAYPAPLAVGLNAAEAYGKTAWGLASTDGHFLGEVLNDSATVTDAFLAAFAALVEREEFRGLPIDLYCASPALCEALTELIAAFPHITVHPWSETTSRGLLVRTAHKAAFTAIQNLDPGHAVDLPATLAGQPAADGAPIIAATDGSAGFRSRKNAKMVSGWAWIANNGTHGCGAIDGGSILAAEVHAIRSLLESTRRDTPLIVLSDSRDALRLIEGLQAGQPPVSLAATGKMLPTLRRIQHIITGRQVTFDWVRSHSGHALNEGADRLAVHARRAAQHDLADDVRRTLVRQIVDDTLHSLPATSAAA